MIQLIFLLQVLQFFVCFNITRRSRFNALIINVLCVSHFVLYVLPLVLFHNEYRHLDSLIFFSSTSLFCSTFFMMIVYKNSNIQPVNRQTIYDQLKGLKKGSLVLVALFFIFLSLYAVFKSLQNIGGIFAMLVTSGGGREYLEARVNSENSGLYGVLIWLSPIAINYLLLNLLIEIKRKKRIFKRLVFFSLLTLIMSGYLLLTVRHNAIATLLMLYVTLSFLRKISRKQLLFIVVGILSIFYLFQAIRLSTVSELSFEKITNSKSRESEHLEVTTSIVNTVEQRGYTYLEHTSDIFLFLIPRRFWKDKPKTSYLNRLYFRETSYDGSEKAIGIIGEGYSMFGHAGVFTLVFFFSMIISFLQYKLDKLKFSVFYFFTFLAIVPLSYIGIRTGVFGKHLISVYLMMFQAYVFYWIYKRRIT